MDHNKTPFDILEIAYQQAFKHIEQSYIDNEDAQNKIDLVSRSSIGARVRLLLACTLAKIHDPGIDIRKPFTDSGAGAYSGRSYDENFITDFINRYDLPCNSTTAFLTPALRTKGGVILERGTDLGGRKKGPYANVISLINDVHEGKLAAESLLVETIRCLLRIKQEREQRIASLLSEVERGQSEISLSSEDIVNLLQQHLGQKYASRLPVLAIAAVYETASNQLGEQVLPLHPHTAADDRTGALGDIEITLVNDNRVVTTYEIKTKKVTRDDINRALQKLQNTLYLIDNYIFITTDDIDEQVAEYAESLYRRTGGVEFTILDCIDFVRHFLHLFHRLRLEFLETYQALLLNEPKSAVRDELKEVFLTLRRSAESSYSIDDED